MSFITKYFVWCVKKISRGNMTSENIWLYVGNILRWNVISGKFVVKSVLNNEIHCMMCGNYFKMKCVQLQPIMPSVENISRWNTTSDNVWLKVSLITNSFVWCVENISSWNVTSGNICLKVSLITKSFVYCVENI